MKNILLTFAVIFISTPAFAQNGMINIPSDFNVDETAMRMEKILKEKGMTIFKVVKHSEAAGKVDIELRDTKLIIFGNPKIGSKLMKCQQSVAIDLPQKALIWVDEQGKVWLSYNDPRYIEKKHNITGCEAVIAKIEKALAGISKLASTK